MPGSGKLRLATASLAGCFGCHMSFLDIDERILELIDVVEFDRTPLTDIKIIGECDVGLIEGGVANAENVEVLRDFRRHCRVLVAMGACAVNGGIPAMRNQFELEDCLNEAYVNGIGSYFQLCGYVTDAALPEMSSIGDSKRLLLGDCENCGICTSICPTGAITQERVLLHAEKCLTYANENAGEWPDWVDSHAHNCLLGCLECQRMCPANPELPIENLKLHFSAAETQRLLSDEKTANDQAETGIRFKLAYLGQPNIESVLGRNLRAFLKAKDL